MFNVIVVLIAFLLLGVVIGGLPLVCVFSFCVLCLLLLISLLMVVPLLQIMRILICITIGRLLGLVLLLLCRTSIIRLFVFLLLFLVVYSSYPSSCHSHLCCSCTCSTGSVDYCVSAS